MSSSRTTRHAAFSHGTTGAVLLELRGASERADHRGAGGHLPRGVKGQGEHGDPSIEHLGLLKLVLLRGGQVASYVQRVEAQVAGNAVRLPLVEAQACSGPAANIQELGRRERDQRHGQRRSDVRMEDARGHAVRGQVAAVEETAYARVEILLRRQRDG